MYLSDGALTAVGTAVVSALAVGAAIGLHTIAGDPVAPVPVASGSPASTSPSPTSNAAMSDDFCTLMGQVQTFADETNQANATMFGDNAASGDEQAQLDTIHAAGQEMLDATSTYVPYFRHAAEIVDDASTAAAFTEFADAVEVILPKFGQMAVDATDAESFGQGMFGLIFDPDVVAASAKSESASGVIDAYVSATCAIDLGLSGSGEDSTSTSTSKSAETDAQGLGEALAAAFTSWNGGDPLPQVSLSDGTFKITTQSVTANGTATGYSTFSASSSDVAIADLEINGPTDWCVSVSSGGDQPDFYRYSADYGLEPGTCADLVGS